MYRRERRALRELGERHGAAIGKSHWFLWSSALTVLIVVAGCGPASPGAGAPATTPAASPAQTVAVPTKTQLKSELLTEAEIGAPFKADTAAETPSDSGKTSGCELL